MPKVGFQNWRPAFDRAIDGTRQGTTAACSGLTKAHADRMLAVFVQDFSEYAVALRSQPKGGSSGIPAARGLDATERLKQALELVFRDAQPRIPTPGPCQLRARPRLDLSPPAELERAVRGVDSQRVPLLAGLLEVIDKVKGPRSSLESRMSSLMATLKSLHGPTGCDSCGAAGASRHPDRDPDSQHSR